MKAFICTICGHIAFEKAPEKCPVCGATTFTQNDDVFKEAAEKSKEAAVKHIPDITVKKECKLIPETGCLDVIVRIGKTLHPMEEKHHIEFIDGYVDGIFISRVYLTPNVNPAACFHIRTKGKKMIVVEKCNLHGHWMSEAAVG